mgnify:FL=1
MSSLKEQLKNVLEDEKHFSQETEQQILSKINSKSIFYKWKIGVSLIAIASICALLFVFIPKETEQQSIAALFEIMDVDGKYQLVLEDYDVQQKKRCGHCLSIT